MVVSVVLKMTANHEHTPTTEVIRETYIGEPPYTLYGYTEEEFDRWLATVEAAAEQRGAVKALRSAADIKLGNGYYEMLVEDELNYRADLLEGDDE